MTAQGTITKEGVDLPPFERSLSETYIYNAKSSIYLFQYLSSLPPPSPSREISDTTVTHQQICVHNVIR